MPQLDFPPQYMKVLNEIIHEHIPDAEIWAFGSRVTQQHHDASDLDLTVHNVESVESLDDFRTAVINSNIPVLIDILNWESIPQSFKDEIQKRHVVIHVPKNINNK